MRTSTAKRNLRSNGNGHVLNADWMRIKNSFSDTAADIKKAADSMVHDSAHDIRQRSRELQHRMGAYTAKKPIKSLGIAALTGLVVGLWLRR